MTDDPITKLRPPRDSLYRELAVAEAVEFRDEDDLGDEYIGLLRGHFLVFNQWTEIKSIFEGNFVERFAPGSTKKTITENRQAMRPLFQHGRDPQVGDKPLGPIRELREDDYGTYYEVPLLDTSYNRDLLPILKAGLLGASHRFRVMREVIDDEPEMSDHNPRALPERTIKEASILEFGPVTFPAYAGATAGVRSLTDPILFGDFARDPEALRALVDMITAKRVTDFQIDDISSPYYGNRTQRASKGGAAPPVGPVAPEDVSDNNPVEDAAPPQDRAGEKSHPDLGRRNSRPLYGLPRKDKPKWLL